MQEQLISFETAKLAKEKGFDVYQEECWYKKEESTASFHTTEEFIDITYRPTQSLLQKWLEEEHDLYLQPEYYYKNFEAHVLINILKIKDKGSEEAHFFVVESFMRVPLREWKEKGLQEALKLLT